MDEMNTEIDNIAEEYEQNVTTKTNYHMFRSMMN